MRRWLPGTMALGLAAMAAFLLHRAEQGPGATPRAPRADAAARTAGPTGASGATPAPAGQAPDVGPARLSPGASVQFIIQYPGCGAQRSGEGPLPAGLVGMDRVQVARQFAQAAVVSLTPDRLVLRRALPGCPGGVVTLVERGGVVTVVAGRPGDLGAVVARTDLPVRALGREDRLRLERGIVVPEGAWERTVADLRGG